MLCECIRARHFAVSSRQLKRHQLKRSFTHAMHGRNNWPFVPWLVLAAGAALSAEQPQQSQEVTVEALMPDYATSVNDAYLCTAVALPDEPLKLIEIRPQASQAVAHHMLLFGAFGRS